MIALFHRAKHWQLFTFLYGGAIFFQLFGMFVMSTSMNEAIAANRPPDLSGFFWAFVPIMLIVMGITFGWQWSIGSGLKDKLPHGVVMNFKLYRAFSIVPVVYIVIYLCFFFFMFNRIGNMVHTANPIEAIQAFLGMFVGMIILIPIGLFATFCMFYNMVYCAKTLKSIELGREADLGDYIGYFFLFWFNFVGFWIIQPVVNQITSEDWIPPAPPPGYEPPIDPDPTFDPIPQKEVVPRGELLKTKDHEAFEHDDDFDGLF